MNSTFNKQKIILHEELADKELKTKAL